MLFVSDDITSRPGGGCHDHAWWRKSTVTIQWANSSSRVKQSKCLRALLEQTFQFNCIYMEVWHRWKKHIYTNDKEERVFILFILTVHINKVSYFLWPLNAPLSSPHVRTPSSAQAALTLSGRKRGEGTWFSWVFSSQQQEWRHLLLKLRNPGTKERKNSELRGRKASILTCWKSGVEWLDEGEKQRW